MFTNRTYKGVNIWRLLIFQSKLCQEKNKQKEKTDETTQDGALRMIIYLHLLSRVDADAIINEEVKTDELIFSL